MATWRIVSCGREYEPSESDCRSVGDTTSSETARRELRVEVADTGMMAESIDDDEAGRALQTQGRSAVESVLGEDDPPGRLVVSTYGVTSG